MILFIINTLQGEQKHSALVFAEHYDDDLEEEFHEVLSQDFNMECEDGSPREVRTALRPAQLSASTAGPF